MKKFRLRVQGQNHWQDWQGYDYHDAAQEFAKWYDFQNAELTNGNKIVIEIMELGKKEIKLVALFAEFVVRYYSVDV